MELPESPNLNHDLERCLRYSLSSKRLVLFLESKYLALINLDAKKIEFQLKKAASEVITYRLFGKDQNKIAAITDDSRLLLYILSYPRKKLLASTQFELPLSQKREETLTSFAVCDKTENDYILLQTHIRFQGCRMIILKVSGNTLVETVNVIENSRKKSKGILRELKFYGCFGNCILWVGLEEWGEKAATLYAFDVITEELREVNSKRAKHLVRKPVGICFFGEDFYYTGLKVKLMKLCITYQK